MHPTLFRNVAFHDIHQKKKKPANSISEIPIALLLCHYYTTGNIIHNAEMPPVFGLAGSPSLLDLYQVVLQAELLATSFGTLGNFSTSQSKGPDNWHSIMLQGYFLNCDTSQNMILAFGHNVFFWYLRLTLGAITLSARFCSRDAQPLKLLTALPQTWLCSLNQLLPMAFH